MTRSLISISLMRFPLSLAHGGATYSVCSLPPCGQGNRIWVNKYESLTERTESKSSEIPVLFTHMRLPCPQGGGERTELAAPADSTSTERALEEGCNVGRRQLGREDFSQSAIISRKPGQRPLQLAIAREES